VRIARHRANFYANNPPGEAMKKADDDTVIIAPVDAPEVAAVDDSIIQTTSEVPEVSPVDEPEQTGPPSVDADSADDPEKDAGTDDHMDTTDQAQLSAPEEPAKAPAKPKAPAKKRKKSAPKAKAQ
jgi:hypothetical protein